MASSAANGSSISSTRGIGATIKRRKTHELNLSQRSGDQDAAVRAIAIQILRRLGVHDDAAVIAGRGSVHEMQDSIICAEREANMCGGIKSTSVARNYSDDVA